MEKPDKRKQWEFIKEMMPELAEKILNCPVLKGCELLRLVDRDGNEIK